MQNLNLLLALMITDLFYFLGHVISTSPKSVIVSMLVELDCQSIQIQQIFGNCQEQHSNFNIPKTLMLNGAFFSNKQDAANMFTSYFKSVYLCEVINDDVRHLGIPFF